MMTCTDLIRCATGFRPEWQSEAIALFLHATRSGLFMMEWQLVCAGCGHLVESLRSMGNLHSHYGCDLCFTENEASLDDLIHVTFTVSPEIRRLAFHEPDTLPIEDFYFKYRMSKGIRPLPLPGEPTLNEILLSVTKLLIEPSGSAFPSLSDRTRAARPKRTARLTWRTEDMKRRSLALYNWISSNQPGSNCECAHGG